LVQLAGLYEQNMKIRNLINGEASSLNFVEDFSLS
jgi:hypothetical protein